MQTVKPEIDASAPARPPVRVAPPSAVKKLAFALVTLVLSVSLSVLLAEVVLRALGVKAVPPHYGDAALGLGAPIRADETFDFPEYGGKLRMRTNNMGFHEDADTPVAKKPATYRIAFVGDSQTAGECTNEENYPNIFEQKLNAAAGRQEYEVINAAVGRYSPYQYYVRAERDVIPLKPDHLIVGIYLGNDYMDLIRHDDRPYLTIGSGGEIRNHRPEFILFDDPTKPPSRIASSRVYSEMRTTLGPGVYYQYTRARMLTECFSGPGRHFWDFAGYMMEVKRLTDISLGLMTQSLLQNVWFHHFPETYKTASTLNRHVMKLFKDLCDRNGIQLTYVLVPTKVRVEPEDVAGIFAKLAVRDRTLTPARLSAFEDEIAEDVLRSCNDLQVDVIDLRAEMINSKGGVRRYYPEEMHLNPAGNQLIADILRKKMEHPELRENHSRPAFAKVRD